MTDAANESDDTKTATRVRRVAVTASAQTMLEHLEEMHGPLVFHQSDGCCDGSSPMCFPRKEFKLGQRDVYLGTIANRRRGGSSPSTPPVVLSDDSSG